MVQNANVRIIGVDIPGGKQIWISLQNIYGIGKTRAKQICQEANINPIKRTATLSEDEIIALRKAVENYKLEGDLKREEAICKDILIKTKSYRGNRHLLGLPCRGQNTRRNARTRRGRRSRPITGKKTVKK